MPPDLSWIGNKDRSELELYGGGKKKAARDFALRGRERLGTGFE
jgi:hypothetical protein